MSEPTERDYLEGLTREQREEHEGTPMTAPPTTGAEAKTIDVECPLCWDSVTLNVGWDGENDDMGYELSRYPVISDDPKEAIHSKGCSCDFGKTLMAAWAEHLNDGRIDDYLDPHANDDADLDDTAVPDAELIENLGVILESVEEAEPYLIRYESGGYPRKHIEVVRAWLAQEGRDGNG